MKTLYHKLWHDLGTLKGQALAIAVVVASGMATFVMALSTLDSLRTTRADFYRDYRFADVFVSLKRAPESLRSRIEQIPGVARVETRVVAPATLDIPGYSDPATGLLVSIPDTGQPLLNQIYLRQGRLPEPGRDDEVVLSDAFAQAHGFHPGDRLRAVIHGRSRTLVIAGVGVSPEFIYQIRPGTLFPDFAAYGILWMSRSGLEAAYNMEGGFNNAVLSLSAGGSLPEVLERLDDVLQIYGGLGSYGRMDQISHRFLSEEFRQLEEMATIYPVIFLGVAAFLLHIVLSRLVRTQREQIAILKAFGYRNLDIGLHYVQLTLAIVLVGVALGLVVGVQCGKWMSEIYMRFYRFPYLEYRLNAQVPLLAAGISSVAALLGTIFTVWEAAMSPPAEAMRPEPPASYRETFVERLGMKRWLSQPARMIVRNLARRPLKFALSVLAVSFAVAILMVGRFSEGSIRHMMTVQFNLSERADLTVAFIEPTSRKALYDLSRLEGVQYAEVYRSVPVRLRFEHRSYRTAIDGVEPGGDLYRLLDTELEPIPIPPSGIVMTDQLAKILGVKPGDRLTAEVLEGRRPVVEIPIAGLTHQYLGVAAYMDLKALNRLLREGDAISGVYISADSRYRQGIYDALKGMPQVAGTMIREKAWQSLRETMAEQLLLFALIATLFAGSIAFGVVYNNARITLSERSREMATLRVLGFTRGEISFILLGELAVLTLAAIPLGFLVGRALCAYVIRVLQTDLFRIPLIIEPSVYAFAATVVLVSAIISSLVVRHRLDHLDLVAVLKMKE